MSSFVRSYMRHGLWVGGFLGYCMQCALVQSGTFIFGTVMDVAGAGTVENVFAAALGHGVSGASTDVVGAELDCQQAEITQISSEVAALQANIANLNTQLADQKNKDLANNIATDYQRLQADLAALNPIPTSGPRVANGTTFTNRTHNGAAASASNSPTVDVNWQTFT